MKTAALVIALLVLLALAGAALLYTPDLSRTALERKYQNAATHDIVVEGIRLRVRDTGPRHAPALVFLHGFGSSLETWEPWSAVLSKNYRVIRFDLPGFGLTGPDPSGDYSDERASGVLAALIGRLGISRPILAGNSLGGRIAWRFAAEHPAMVAGLILISPDGFASPGFAYGKAPDVPLLLRLLPYALPRFLLRMNLAAAYADPRHLTAATLTRYRDMMLAPGDRGAMLARMSQTVLPEPAPLLRRIAAPTLILWGEQDKMIPFGNAADYESAIPNATLVALPGLGHVPFEEAPGRALAPVLAFLSGLDQRTISPAVSKDGSQGR